MFNLDQAIAEWRRQMLAAGIKTPTLLLTGGADMYAPPPVLKRFTDRIRGSQSLIIPEAGHSSYWEQPELFNRAILDFIGRHGT